MKKLFIAFALLFCLISRVPTIAQVGLGKKILFIRGGNGSGGLNSGNNSHLSDINDFSTNGGNHGWGELATLLEGEGYTLEQITEGSGGNSPVDLANLNLNQYALVVFGSNNATYGNAAVNALMSYLNNGGAALFISDANFGSNWNDAPSSDNHFLSEIGWEMNQDQGTYNLSSFEVPNHPILQGISSIGGEGVSPITLKDNNVSGVNSTILVKVPSDKNVRRVTNGTNQGPSTSSNDNDAVLIVAQVGQGRVAGHFDRNTFFNNNGAGGRDLNKLDHIPYARNLFNWLAGSSAPPANLSPVVNISSPANGASFNLGTKVNVKAAINDADGEVSNARLLLDGNLVRQINQSPFEWGNGNDDPVLGNLSLGNHTLAVVATDDDGASSTKSVNIVVLDPNVVNPPPSISFSGLKDGDTFPVGTSLDVVAVVSDPNGSVAFADLFINDVFIRKERLTPYEWGDARDTELLNMAAGSYTLKVEAEDNEGAKSSSEITISIADEPNVVPLVSITSPQSGDKFTEGEDVIVTVNASDPDGSISKVELFDGSENVGEDNSPPYVFTISNVSLRNLSLTARATDNDQAQATSAAINIIVEAPANQAPNVNISSPQDGSSFVEGDAIRVTVEANDVDGTISKVELFDGGSKLGEDNNAPYEFIINNAVVGTLNLTARATDNDNAQRISSGIGISVASPANQVPSVNISSPQDGQKFVEGDDITVTVAASDNDGTISKVELFGGGNKLGEDNTAPYVFSIDNAQMGTLDLMARATDNDQAVSNSTLVSIEVEGASTSPQDFNLSPIEDAYVEGSQGQNNGFLKVEQGFRVAYLKFDLSQVKGDVSNAQLQMTVSADAGNGNIQVLLGNDNNWSEGTLNSNNAPGIGSQLGSLNTSYALNQTYTWNLDAGQISGGGIISLIVRQASGGSDAWFSSKEGGKGPVLLLTALGSDTPPVNEAPRVNISSPQNGSSFVEGDNISVTVSADDSDGSVAKVELFDGLQKIAEDTSSPYVFNLNNVSAGSLNLIARATDNDQAETNSTAVNVNVNPAANEPPTVGISSPQGGATFTEGDNITITALANDTDGSVTKVEFFDGTQKLGEDSNAPFELTINNVGSGTLLLRAQATDDDLAQTSSASVQVVVEGASNDPPQEVSLSPIQDAYLEGASGFNNAFLKVEQGFRVSYLKFDLSGIDGDIAKAQLQMTVSTDAGNGNLEVLLGSNQNWTELNISPGNAPSPGTSLGSLNTSYALNQTYTWNLEASQLSGGGMLSLVIRQVTGSSDVWFSAKEGSQAPQLLLTVNASGNPPANQAPTVNITSPQSGTKFVEGDNITVNVSANDPDGMVAKVELFDGNQKLGEDSNAPYTFSLNNVSAGLLNLRAVATDDDQASSSSSIINLEVEAPGTEPQDISLSPIQDAYLEGSQGLNDAFLKIEQGFRVSYLRFDLSGISGDISQAQLEMTVSKDVGNGQIQVLLGNGNNWTEANLSPGNAPAAGNLLAVLNTFYNLNQTYSWDLNPGLISGGGTLNLVIRQVSGSSDVWFSSREGANAPKLNLKVQPLNQQSKALHILDVQLKEANIYPNQARHYLNVEGPEDRSTIQIFNQLGEKLAIKWKGEQIDVSQLSQGLYFLEWKGRIYRFVKE